MFLIENHATGALKCDYPHVNTSLMCWLRAHQFFQWASVYSLQPLLYRLKTWSKSTRGAHRLNGLAPAYAHEITPEPLQILHKLL